MPTPENEKSPAYDKETRQIVTHYAFGVSDDLIGTKLASPSRRAAALLIDFVVISALSGVSVIFMALTFGYLSINIGNHVKNALAKSGLRFLSALLFITFSIVAYSQHFSISFNFTTTPTNAVVDSVSTGEVEKTTTQEDLTEIDPEAINNTELAKAQSPDTECSCEYSIIKWAEGTLADFGLGFSWAIFYFTVLLAVFNGQTVGKRLLRIKVVKLDGSYLSLWESFGRYGGYGAGIATGLLGFLQIFWDANRQGIHDKIAETLVISANK